MLVSPAVNNQSVIFWNLSWAARSHYCRSSLQERNNRLRKSRDLSASHTDLARWRSSEPLPVRTLASAVTSQMMPPTVQFVWGRFGVFSFIICSHRGIIGESYALSSKSGGDFSNYYLFSWPLPARVVTGRRMKPNNKIILKNVIFSLTWM